MWRSHLRATQERLGAWPLSFSANLTVARMIWCPQIKRTDRCYSSSCYFITHAEVASLMGYTHHD